jgi:hypothetical protein
MQTLAAPRINVDADVESVDRSAGATERCARPASNHLDAAQHDVAVAVALALAAFVGVVVALGVVVAMTVAPAVADGGASLGL